MPSSLVSTATSPPPRLRQRRGDVGRAGREHRLHRPADLEPELRQRLLAAGRAPRRHDRHRRAGQHRRAAYGGERHRRRPPRPPPAPARRGRPGAPRRSPHRAATPAPRRSPGRTARPPPRPGPPATRSRRAPRSRSNASCTSSTVSVAESAGCRQRLQPAPAEPGAPLAQRPREVGGDRLELLGVGAAQQARRSPPPWPCASGWRRPRWRWRRRRRAAWAQSTLQRRHQDSRLHLDPGPLVVVLVLAAAVLHAGWNAIAHTAEDRLVGLRADLVRRRSSSAGRWSLVTQPARPALLRAGHGSRRRSTSRTSLLLHRQPTSSPTSAARTRSSRGTGVALVAFASIVLPRSPLGADVVVGVGLVVLGLVGVTLAGPPLTLGDRRGIATALGHRRRDRRLHRRRRATPSPAARRSSRTPAG